VYLNKKIKIDMGLQNNLGQNYNEKIINKKRTYLAWAFKLVWAFILLHLGLHSSPLGPLSFST